MIPVDANPIYLASRSPRRRALLEQIGVPYTLLGHDTVDESVHAGETPEAYVARVTRAKAEAGWTRIRTAGLATAPVLAADTAVVAGGRILGKPADRAEAPFRLFAAIQDEHVRCRQDRVGVEHAQALHDGDLMIPFERLDERPVVGHSRTG